MGVVALQGLLLYKDSPHLARTLLLPTFDSIGLTWLIICGNQGRRSCKLPSCKKNQGTKQSANCVMIPYYSLYGSLQCSQTNGQLSSRSIAVDLMSGTLI